jgi:hypothetical protein
VIFQYMNTMSNDKIRVIGISITSDIYHFFLLGTFIILIWPILNQLLSTIVILLFYRTLEVFYLSSCTHVPVNHFLPIPFLPLYPSKILANTVFPTSTRSTYKWNVVFIERLTLNDYQTYRGIVKISYFYLS